MKVKDLKKQSGTKWERLSLMNDNEIDLAENPELDNGFFANATLHLPEPKKSVSLRLDPEVLAWYKHKGPGYQTRINAVLKMYMQAKSKKTHRVSKMRRIGNPMKLK